MSPLGPEPAELAPLPAEFLRGLTALLDALAPPLLDAAMTKATPRDDGVEVVLAHATTIAFGVWAQAARETVVVGCAALHTEHATAASALAVVGELLRGEREIPNYDGSTLRPSFVGPAGA